MKINLWEVFIVFIAAFSLGLSAMSSVRYHDAANNKLEGYHCQPITTHSTLEDAKAKVIEYQERVK